MRKQDQMVEYYLLGVLTVKSWAAANATKAARATKMGRDMVYCSDAGKLKGQGM
jgi:hypothetical protein